MEKILNKLPLGLFVVYTGKLLLMGGTLVDAALMAVLASTAAVFEFKKDTRIEQLSKQIETLSGRLSKNEEETSNMRSFLNGTKIAQAFTARK